MLMPDPSTLTADNAAARDYIAAMAEELAQMARDGGDRRLALVLDLAATFAELPSRQT